MHFNKLSSINKRNSKKTDHNPQGTWAVPGRVHLRLNREEVVGGYDLNGMQIDVNTTMKYKYLIYIASWLLIVACGSNKRTYFDNKIDANPIKINRFDIDLIQLDTTDTQASVRALYTKYPDFMPIFMENVLGITAQDTTYVASVLPHFLSDTTFKKVNAKVLETFKEIDQYEKALGNAFARYQHFYPDAQQPTFYFFVSGFSRTFTMHQNILAVASDMYLGPDYPYYNQIVYEYMKYAMRPECIPIDFISAYLFQHFRLDQTRVRLIDDMLYRGKLMYFLSILFPDVNESEIMAYTPEEWAWCKKYEKDIWNTLLDKKDLFTTDHRTITSYMNDAPFTSPISEDSPGRLGTWIGMQIAKSYMEHNQDVNMQEFLANKNAQNILEQSKYRP